MRLKRISGVAISQRDATGLMKDIAASGRITHEDLQRVNPREGRRDRGMLIWDIRLLIEEVGSAVDSHVQWDGRSFCRLSKRHNYVLLEVKGEIPKGEYADALRNGLGPGETLEVEVGRYMGI